MKAGGSIGWDAVASAVTLRLVAVAVQHIRRTAKLLANFATVWAAFIALAVGMSWSDDSWQALAYTVLGYTTPIAHVILIGASTVREQATPRAAKLLYIAAILCLAPEHLLMVLR